MKLDTLRELAKTKRCISPMDFANHFLEWATDPRVNTNTCFTLKKLINSNPSPAHLRSIAQAVPLLSREILNYVYSNGQIDLPAGCGSFAVILIDKFFMPHYDYLYQTWMTPGQPFISWAIPFTCVSSCSKWPEDTNFIFNDKIYHYAKTHQAELLQVAQPPCYRDEYASTKISRSQLKKFYALHPEKKLPLYKQKKK